MTSSSTLATYARHRSTFGNDFDAWIDLFTDESVLEFPYLSSLHLPDRIVGKEAIRAFMAPALSGLSNFSFVDETVFAAADPNQLFAEFAVEATVDATGAKYHQLRSARMTMENGKILLLHEYVDTVSVAKAIFPGGLADLIETA